MQISLNRFLQSLRWLALLLLAVVVASCSGAGNCAPSNGTVVDLHTFPNGSQLFGTTSLNIASGESTTTTYVLKGGSGLTIVNLSTQESGFNTAALSHGLTRNCALCGSFNPESLVVTGTSAESSSQLTVNVRSGLAVGTYTLNLYATYTNDGVTQDKEQIGVISVTVTAATAQPGVLAIYSVAESTINVGESTTAVISLNNSSGITTPVDVAIASNNTAVMTVSPASCALTTASSSCNVTLTGVATGTTTFNAAATGYTTATSDAVMVVTSQVRIYLPQTGQMNQVPSMCSPISATCIDSPVGSDGYGYISGSYNIPYGVAWAYNGYDDLVPQVRFTSGSDANGSACPNGQGVESDNLTGLMWQQNPLTATYKWQDDTVTPNTYPALAAVESLNSGSGYCGYTDWRLPNINELASMLNLGQKVPYTWLNTGGFPGVGNFSYWSSTTMVASGSSAWVVMLDNTGYGRITTQNKTSSTAPIWAVRGNSATSTAPAKIPQTGQTTSYAAGDDGALQEGTAGTNVSGRFESGTETEANCIIDKQTGLMWPKNGIIGFTATSGGSLINQPTYDNTDAALNSITWSNALTAMTKMNAATTKLCGHNDWRLPNFTELRSLINYGQVNYSISSNWLNNQGFSGVQNKKYWTSTILASTPSSTMWLIDMGIGETTFNDGNNPYNVLPVRGGGAVGP